MGIVFLVSGLVVALAGYAVGTIQIHAELADHQFESHESKLADLFPVVPIAMYWIAFGVGSALLGTAFTLAAVCRGNYRAKWFARSALTVSILWCLGMAPWGLVIGLPVLAAMWIKRREPDAQG